MDKTTKKNETVIRWVAGILLVVILLALIIFRKPQSGAYTVADGTVEFHYLDVGQADATLIITESVKILLSEIAS